MKFEIYCDECRPELFTSKRKERPYLSIGGIWIPAEARTNIKEEINQIRVAVVQGNYIVIIRFDKYYSKAFFVTAFVSDTPRTIQKIKHGKKWKLKSR